MKIVFTLFFLTAMVFCAFSQKFSVKGVVLDAESNVYLPAATVQLSPTSQSRQADRDGFFVFGNLPGDTYQVSVQCIGYQEFITDLTLVGDTSVTIRLQPDTYVLSEVTVSAYNNRRRDMPAALPMQEISRAYLLQNNSTNFVKTLSSVPGISSMDIGAGFSKPVIRGFGFNRVAVADKGIVQQNQQWGADHGLEIDQYDVDNVRVHKGPMSLFFGSDAVGGVIEILPANVPHFNMFWGDATLISKSNNGLFGASVMTSLKRNNWFVRARATAQSYADYRVPADTIAYLTWKMPLHNRRMKNTAGREYNVSLSANYDNGTISSWTHASNIYGKNGFFPGAHGIPVLSRLEPDASDRNIEMPYSFSNHFKISNNSVIGLGAYKLLFDVGFQQNKRMEMSKFHTHYSNQQPPEKNPDRELSFLLNTYSANVRMAFDEEKQWSKTVGISSEYQHNRVGGYSFLLANFNRFSAGAFWLNSLKINPQFTLAGGIRYDVGKLSVKGFFDPVLEEYLLTQHYSTDDATFYAQRAADLRKTFNDISGSVGFVYTPNAQHSLKMNIGRSFRYPSANELASNGVHHGAFRHEKGNPGLDSEKGYQLDVDYRYSVKKFALSFNPFAAYFSNYIYLEPSGEWSILPHTGQIYAYKQTAAFMAGGELSAHYALAEGWLVNAGVEYLYNYNITDGYPLPFSPPTSAIAGISYSGNGRKALRLYVFRIENRWIAAQNRIAKNEQKTPGAHLVNVSANMFWSVGRFGFMTDVQVQNLFDTAFFNHLSFYRKINAPEPGRNIQLIVKIPF